MEELDWAFISKARLLHLTGITPALSEVCRQTTIKMVEKARAIDMHISFDVNYRSLLWTAAEARSTFEEILPYVDLLIATQADTALLLGEEVKTRQALHSLRGRYGCDIVVITLGSEGSMAFDGKTFYRGAAYSLQEVNRLGAGDAFDAGLIYGWLRSDVQLGLNYGGAMAALKHTIPQNIPLLNKDDIEQLLDGTRVDVHR
jgi:2-dehydro-3-deoxygluconokinase